MAYKLQTEIGKAIYGLRKCTVEYATLAQVVKVWYIRRFKAWLD